VLLGFGFGGFGIFVAAHDVRAVQFVPDVHPLAARSQLLWPLLVGIPTCLLSDFGRRHLGKFCRRPLYARSCAPASIFATDVLPPALGVACTLCIHSVHHRFTNLPVAMGLDGAISSGMD